MTIYQTKKNKLITTMERGTTGSLAGHQNVFRGNTTLNTLMQRKLHGVILLCCDKGTQNVYYFYLHTVKYIHINKII